MLVFGFVSSLISRLVAAIEKISRADRASFKLKLLAQDRGSRPTTDVMDRSIYYPYSMQHKQTSCHCSTTTRVMMKLLSLSLLVTASSGFAPRTFPRSMSATAPKRSMVDPIVHTADMLLAAEEAEIGEVGKTIVIALVFGGGLIPALISANTAMFKAMSGRKGEDEEEVDSNSDGKSFDPTLKETKYRKYVVNSGATGPDLPLSTLLFAQDRIPVSDVVAVLGRIKDVQSVADWKNLPSTKLPNVSTTDPPMWLPRKAFKVNIRKAKFLGKSS